MRKYGKGSDSHLFKDIVNQRFGNLVAKEYKEVVSRNGRKLYKWKCVCDCGNDCYVRPAELTRGTRIDCKTCSKKRQADKQRLSVGTAELNRVLRTYKKHAKLKNLPFLLSRSEFNQLIKLKCEYCGSPPKKYTDGCERNGIDRVDSSKGYVVGNVVPCCEMCNRAKLDHDRQTFVEWIDRAYKHQHGEDV